MFLVDTSVWIDYFRPKTAPRLKDRVRGLLESGAVLTSRVIIVELLRDARKESEYRRLESALFALPRIPLDQDILKRASEWGFRLDRKGLVLPTTDLLITASAYPGHTLLHRDKDFTRIAEQFPLKQESLD
jgi:predicted nucleic acid-binding protein